MPDAKINQIFGNRVRIRVCGLCWKADGLLMVNHQGITDSNFWAPPGGGVEFGVSASETLKKEFLEETGVQVDPGRFLFACELVKSPLHAIELFFEAAHIDGLGEVGADPEMRETEQIITEVRFMKLDEILRLPANQRHGIFGFLNTRESLKNSGGFYRI